MSVVFSTCGTYRFLLEREVPNLIPRGPVICFVMVNPSTADAVADDPTIRKVKGFSARLNASKIIVVNKFAFRSSDVAALEHADDPIGPGNDEWIEQAFRDANLHVAAWGTLTKLPSRLRHRWRDIVAISDKTGARLQSFGITQDYHPRHPLMLPYRSTLNTWVHP